MMISGTLMEPWSLIESGFKKKGNESVGVARQYSGAVGKVDNRQVGVYAAYVSEQGYVLGTWCIP